VLQRKNLLKPAKITLTFTPTTNDAYYLPFGSTVNSDNATFIMNGKTLDQYKTYRNTIMVSAADHAKGKKQTLTIQLKKGSLWLDNFTLYQLNTAKFQRAVAQLKTQPWHLTKHSSRYFRGTITTKTAGQVLNTSVPYSTGWHATVNGKRVKTYKTVGMFTAVKLPKGQSTVTLSYWPPLLNAGILVSLVTLLGLTGGWYLTHRRRG